MTKLEDAIREALSQDETRRLDELAAPQGMWGQLGSALTGNLAGWMWFSALLQFALFGAALWAGWHFFHAESGREMALWGFGAGFFAYGLGLMKSWFLQQMDKHEILREIKRLELQVALMANKMPE